VSSPASQINWWPLHAALAWVYSRDLPFTTHAAKSGYTELNKAIPAYTKITERPVHPVLNDNDAWPQLRKEIENGAVLARGVPTQDEDQPSSSMHALEEELSPAEAAVLTTGSYFRYVYLRPMKSVFNGCRF
jgi:hypothetical protein